MELHYRLSYPELLARERKLLSEEIWPSVTREAIRQLDTRSAEQLRTGPQDDAGGVVVAFPARTPAGGA